MEHTIHFQKRKLWLKITIATQEVKPDFEPKPDSKCVLFSLYLATSLCSSVW